MFKLLNAIYIKSNCLKLLIYKSIRIIIQASAVFLQILIFLLPTHVQNLINELMKNIAHLIEDQITYFLLFSDPSRITNRIVYWFNLTDPIIVLRLSRKLYLQSSDAILRQRLSNSVVSHLAKGFTSGKIRIHRRLLASLECWTLNAYQQNKLGQLLISFTNSELFNSIWTRIVTRQESLTLEPATISFVRSTLFVAQHFGPHHSNLCATLQILLDRLNDIILIESQKLSINNGN